MHLQVQLVWNFSFAGRRGSLGLAITPVHAAGIQHEIASMLGVLVNGYSALHVGI